MPDSWSDDLVVPLLDKLKTLAELHRTAVTAVDEAATKIAKIKSESRLKDRHLWLLLWANGDRSIYDDYRSLRDELKHRKQQIAHVPQARKAVVYELDRVIAGELDQNDSGYRAIVTEQRELRRKSDVFDDALTHIRRTRENITRLAASLHIEPRGRSAVAAAKKKSSEISAQLKVVREKVEKVNRIVGSRGVAGSVVRKLDKTVLGAEFGPAERKKRLDEVVTTLNDIDHKVEASRGKVAKRLNDLEKDRTRMVTAKRDHLLVTHGLAMM